MKTKFSKKLISLLISLVIMATTVPAFTLSAEAMITANNDNKYVFAYFTGDEEGQKVRFALSSDGHTFAPLNGNQPYLKSVTDGNIYPSGNGRGSVYPACGYARDPFIIEKEDGNGYWIVATDLKVEKDADGNDLKNTYNNSKLLVWDVSDLSTASNVTPWNIDTNRMFITDYSSNKSTITWAPEVVYDNDVNKYMLFWSGPLYGSTTIQCAYTNDFKTFYTRAGNVIDGVNYEPEALYSYSGTVASGGSQVSIKPIDADIVYDEDTDYYYMVIKNELGSGEAHTGELFILKSRTLSGFNGQAPTKINITGTDTNGDTLIFEGPELYQRNDGRWVLITDQYSQNPLWDYYMFEVEELDDLFSGNEFISKRDQSTNINDCLPRHGAVATVDTETYLSLAKGSAIPSSFPYTANKQGTFGSSDDRSYSGTRTDYKNVLYLDDPAGSGDWVDNLAWSSLVNKGVYVKLAANQGTLLYDGINPTQLGIMARFRYYKSGGSSTRYPTAFVMNTADWGLADNWHGYGSNTTDWNHYDLWKNYSKKVSNTTSNHDDCSTWSITGGITAIGSNSAGDTISNFMCFNGSFASGEYLKTYNQIGVTAYFSGNANDFSTTDNVLYPTINRTICVINYAPIATQAADIKDAYKTYIEDVDDLSIYCPESLDTYLAAVAKITADINVYFLNGNFYQQAANHIQDVVDNGLIDIALAGPAKARIQYGNLFDFDAYYSSGSLTYMVNGRLVHQTQNGYPISIDNLNKTITVTGVGDSYTSMDLKVDTYKIPVEPGQKYIFEFTSDSPYADALIFVPNSDHTSYDPGPDNTYVNNWRLHGEGTQKVELTIPQGKNYVYFRVGVNSSSSQVTAHINRIRLYKAEYENWASRDNDNIPSDRLTNNCAGLLGQPNSEIGFTNYGEPLATPTHLTNKHFCGWYADEELTQPVNSSDDITGCAVLYAKYSDTVEIPAQAATCTSDGKTAGQRCSACNQIEVETQNVSSTGHDFVYSRLGDSDNYEFVCTHDDTHTNTSTDSTAYEYLDMIKDTLDVERFANSADLADGIAAFEAMKTNVVNTHNDTEATIAEADIQPMIDNSIRALLNAMNDSTYSTYNLTFNVYVNGVLVHNETQNKPYNSVVTLDASSYVSGGTCQTWTAQTADTQGTLKAIAQKNDTNTYDVKLQANTVVNAYYVTDDQTNVVTVLDQYGFTLHQFIANSFSISGNVITANGVDYNVPDMPYMAVTGFTGNGQPISGTVSVSSAMTVRPSWEPVDDSYRITLDGDQIGGTYNYDDLVTVRAASTVYAIAIKVAENDYRVVSYSNVYSLYANRDMDFYSVNGSNGEYMIDNKIVTDKLTIHKLDYKLPFVYSAAKNTDTANNKYTAFNAFSTDSNAEIIEVGTLFYKGTGSNVPGEMTIDNENISRSVSKTQISMSNQYSLSAKNAVGSASGLTTRAYVKYSYTYAGTTVVAVEYGNVCSTETLVD